MDSKFYVSLEAARLLKEKGYNEKCTFAYTDTSNGSDINGRIVFNSNDYPVGIYPCPTKAEAIDWLESKGIIIEVFSARIGENRKWCNSIINTKTYITIETPYKFSTRLEAEEVAIIKACEFLENGN